MPANYSFPVIDPDVGSVAPFVYVPRVFGDLAAQLPRKKTKWEKHSSFDDVKSHMAVHEMWEDDYPDVYRRVEPVVLGLQRAVWNFDLWSWHQQLRINRYKKGDDFRLHTDLGGVDQTKLVIVVELGDGDYEGGEFTIVANTGQNTVSSEASLHTFAMMPGDLVICPGWTVHRVEPITRGTRYSLTGWMTGPHWR